MNDKRFLPVWCAVLLLFGGQMVHAQAPVKPAPDSTMVKILFFAALREKLNENYAKAGETFEKILILEPNNAAANYEIAIVNFRQNKLLEAEIAVKKATATDPDNIWYWRMLSELYKRKGDMDALVKVFDQMIRLSPEDASFYFDRSNAFLLGGKTKEAMDGYDALEKKFGNSAMLEKARQRVSADKKGKPEAMGAAVTEEADAGQAALTAGQKLLKAGDLNGALVKFKAILKKNEQLYAAWAYTIDTEIALGLNKDAIKTAEEALSLYPSQAQLYLFLAIALINENQLDDALTNIKTAMGLSENDPALLECYGDVLFLKGNQAEALIQWKKSKSGGNNSAKLKKKIDEKNYIK